MFPLLSSLSSSAVLNFQWDGNGREAHLDGRKALLDSQEWCGGPPEGPGVVGRPYQRAGRGQEALPKTQEWSGGPPGGPGVIGRLSQRPVVDGKQRRRARSGPWALSEGREWSVGPPGGPGVVNRSSQRSGSGREVLPKGRDVFQDGR